MDSDDVITRIETLIIDIEDPDIDRTPQEMIEDLSATLDILMDKEDTGTPQDIKNVDEAIVVALERARDEFYRVIDEVFEYDPFDAFGSALAVELCVYKFCSDSGLVMEWKNKFGFPDYEYEARREAREERKRGG